MAKEYPKLEKEKVKNATVVNMNLLNSRKNGKSIKFDDDDDDNDSVNINNQIFTNSQPDIKKFYQKKQTPTTPNIPINPHQATRMKRMPSMEYDDADSMKGFPRSNTDFHREKCFSVKFETVPKKTHK